MRATILLLALLALTACMPVVATRPLTADVGDAPQVCAMRTLQSLGYSVLDDWGPTDAIRAERDKHARNPFSGDVSADQITVYFDDEQMRIEGMTIRAGRPNTLRRFPKPVDPALTGAEGTAYPSIPSKEVRDDVARLAEFCAS